MNITDLITDRMHENLKPGDINEFEKYRWLVEMIATEHHANQAKDNEVLDIVSLCTYVVKDFEDGLNYMNSRGEWTKQKQFAKIYTEIEAKTIAKINEGRTKLYKG